MSARSRRFGILTLLLIGQFTIATTAAAALPAWCEFFLGRRDTPFLTRNEKLYREMLAKRAKDPKYRPTWSIYEPGRTPDQNLLTDPGYFWFPGNVWNDLLEENYPDVAREARAYHNEHDVEVPTVDTLPEASLEDVPAYFPDVSHPPSLSSDDSLTSSPAPTPGPAPSSARDANSGFFDMFSSPPASPHAHHHHAPADGAPANDANISSPAPSSEPSSPSHSSSSSHSSSTDSGSSSSSSSSTDTSSSSSSSSSSDSGSSSSSDSGSSM